MPFYLNHLQDIKSTGAMHTSRENACQINLTHFILSEDVREFLEIINSRIVYIITVMHIKTLIFVAVFHLYDKFNFDLVIV